MKTKVLLFFTCFIFGISHAQERGASVYLIGSIHNLHKSQSFTEAKFDLLLIKTKPNKILLEFPLEWFDENGLPNNELRKSLEDESQKDGIRDGQLAWKHCQKHQIPCLPFDIKGRNEFFKKNNFFPRLALFSSEIKKFAELNSIYKESLARFQLMYDTCKLMEPEVLNSPICDETIESNANFLYQLYLEARAAKSLQDPDFYQLQEDFWHLRNNTMAYHICEIAKNSMGQNIVVVTGVDHHYYLNRLLSKCPFIELKKW